MTLQILTSLMIAFTVVLGLQLQQQQVNASLLPSTEGYSELIFNIITRDAQGERLINEFYTTCANTIIQYFDMSSELQQSALGQNVYNDMLTCDHNVLYVKGWCEFVGSDKVTSQEFGKWLCDNATFYLEKRGLQSEPATKTFIGND